MSLVVHFSFYIFYEVNYTYIYIHLNIPVTKHVHFQDHSRILSEWGYFAFRRDDFVLCAACAQALMRRSDFQVRPMFGDGGDGF